MLSRLQRRQPSDSLEQASFRVPKQIRQSAVRGCIEHDSTWTVIHSVRFSTSKKREEERRGEEREEERRGRGGDRSGMEWHEWHAGDWPKTDLDLNGEVRVRAVPGCRGGERGRRRDKATTYCTRHKLAASSAPPPTQYLAGSTPCLCSPRWRRCCRWETVDNGDDEAARRRHSSRDNWEARGETRRKTRKMRKTILNSSQSAVRSGQHKARGG